MANIRGNSIVTGFIGAAILCLVSCGNEAPPKLPDPKSTNNDQLISGSGQTVSADQTVDTSNASAQAANVGATIGDEEEKKAAKECITANKRYDRGTKECDAQHQPIMSYVWSVDGIVGGLNLQGASAEKFRAYFLAGGQFEGWMIDQVTKGPEGKVWIWVVKDSGSFVITNYFVIGGVS